MKRVVDVRNPRPISELELERIANEIKSLDPNHYARTFILYFLPEMQVGRGASATTDFEPDLSIEVFGVRPEQLASAYLPERRRPNEIGCWINEGLGGSEITILRENNETILECVFFNGGRLIERVDESRSAAGLIFRTKNDESPKEVVSATTRESLRELLRELNGFKGLGEFHDIGFRVGSDYRGWLDRVSRKRNDGRLDVFEETA